MLISSVPLTNWLLDLTLKRLKKLIWIKLQLHFSSLYYVLIHRKYQNSTKSLDLSFFSKLPFAQINGIYFLFEITNSSCWNQKIFVFWVQRFAKSILHKLMFALMSLRYYLLAGPLIDEGLVKLYRGRSRWIS